MYGFVLELWIMWHRGIALTLARRMRLAPYGRAPPPSGVRHAARCLRLRRHCDRPAPRRLLVGPGVVVDRDIRTSLTIGDGVEFSRNVLLYLHRPGARITIGAGSLVNYDTKIFSSREVVIGTNTFISWNVTITDSDFHLIDDALAPDSPVRIGSNVWVGAGAMILKGVEIGDGAIVAAGAVVTTDVPAKTLVAGIPARVVREGVSWR